MKILITIFLQTTQTWLYKLKYIYKDVRKNVFVHKYKQSDMVEDYIHFLKKMEKLKLYMIEFNKDSTIKLKVYHFNCVVEGKNQRAVTVITYDKCIFSANNSMQKA